MSHYDAIVVGAGGVGSAALFHLARRGLRVLGVDPFGPGHDRGSSHGQTRIIRQAYFEHPDYVPLLRRAYQLWSELEKQVQEQLYYEVGLIQIGPPDGIVVPGVRESARLHGLPIEEFSARDMPERFSRRFRVPEGFQAVFEQRAGYLLVERCVLAHLAAAERSGAKLATGQSVQSWRPTGSGVQVQTDRETFSAARLIVTAGAWAGQLLASLNIRLRVLRKHLHWYANHSRLYREEQGCPTFFYEIPDGFYYGFPQIDARGIKVAEHHGGEPVANPLTVDRAVDLEERRRVERFLQSYLPGVSLEPTGHCVCMYTMSPDEHFIVDRHPEYEQVFFAAGLSGHGFKFTAVLGEVLADLAVQGHTSLPIEFLRLDRPALR
jgi:monomeric sarcosine oxidase